MIVPLYDHQKEVLPKMHNGCVLVGKVGSGKSRTALAYFWLYVTNRMRKPRPLYIITTARKRDSLDWEGECANFLITKDPNNTCCRLIVDSWNNLHKYTEVKDAFFIFDEQRVVGSGAWVKGFLRVVKTNQWILLSGTPGDTWSDYIPIFIANRFYRNRTEFIKKHVVFSRFSKYPKIERYINTEWLDAYKKKVLVEMGYERLTISEHKLVKCEYDNQLTRLVYRSRWNPYTNAPIQQAGEWCYTLRKVSNSDISRLNVCLDLFEKHRKVIIFYNFDYELEILRDGFSEYCMGKDVEIAEYNGHNHNDVPESESWVYFVQYNAGSEAWNCITTDTLIFYSLNYSYKMMEQASGRINRMNTPYSILHYYILYSDSVIDKSIRTALRNKRDFNAGRMYNKLYGG